jgi:GT2 family glycosyltransferase
MATRTKPRLEARRLEDIPSVLAIVVTHNGRPWIKDCLVGLNTQSYPLLDVLVVDDASPDSDLEPRLKRVAKRHLKARRWGYVRTPRPLGFGGAINWALSRVRTDADLLLFIHDDAALDRRSVERMTARMLTDDHTAIIGPKIVAWDDVDRLEEIGMAADRFGYPYKGLEEDELDLGQHDASSEVFYVTTTCMLVRHDVFRQLRGWDARLRAFAEDLDLCWRARLAGYLVRTEPMAKARHAIAMATGQRESPFTPARYFIRRNRLRTVFKNVSALRLLTLVPQFILLSFAEMVGFIVLRQPDQIFSLLRALGWNLVRLPQTLRERASIQHHRKVPDRSFRRLTVRESTRIRAYTENQAERLEEAWGRRADVIARRSSQARAVGGELRGWLGAAVVFIVLALLLGFRHVLWAPSASVGEILPYPDGATAMLHAFASPWRAAGLGQPGPAPPALALLSAFPLLTLGAAGAAQKLLILTLGVVGFAGAYRLVADLVDRAGRFTAGAVYMLGAVGYSGLREGSLATLVFGAAAPFVILVLVRLTGWVRPPGWNRGRAIARLALGAAVSAAFVPGSLLIYALVALLLVSTRAFLVPGAAVLRTVPSVLIGLVTAWLLLLPWSTTWFSVGGPLHILFDNSKTYAAAFSGHGMSSVLLGQTPETPAFFGLALPLLGLLAVFLAEGQRKRLALLLWAVIAVLGCLMTGIGAGAVPPFVASPTELGVVIAVAFAGLAGLAVGAFRLDLPRRDFGYMHGVTLASLAAAVFLLAAGIGPALFHGEWDPGTSNSRVDPTVVAQISGLLNAEAQDNGPFRTLWVGPDWAPPEPTAARPVMSSFLTAPEGQLLTDLFESSESPARSQLDRVLASVESGATDEGGSLLGVFNVAYVVLERDASAEPWLGQRDLGLIRTDPRYLVLQNQAPLERAATYDAIPGLVGGMQGDGTRLDSVQKTTERDALERVSTSLYRAENVSEGSAVFLAETEDPNWKASLSGADLPRADAGWGNGFEIPPGAAGELVVSYPRRFSDLLWLAFAALVWIIVVGASFSRRRVHDLVPTSEPSAGDGEEGA